MDHEQIKANVVEHRAIIKALHQYMVSQSIDRKEWGLIFAKAAGYEVFNIAREHGAGRAEWEMGSVILSMAVNEWASEDRLNVK